MIIKSLAIENVRGLSGRHEVDFEDERIAVFVGVNGAGKSTVLECLASCAAQIAGNVGRLRGGGKKSFLTGDQAVSNGYSEGGCGVAFKLGDNMPEGTSNIHIGLGQKPQGNVAMGSDLDNWFKTAIHDPDVEIPVLAYYQTQHSLHLSAESFDDLSSQPDRRGVYENAFQPAIVFDNIIRWFLHQINLQNSEIIQRRDFDYVNPTINEFKEGLTTFLSALEGHEGKIARVVLDEEKGKQVFTYQKDNEKLSFNQLSSGEKLVIGLAMDIAYRCVAANPQLQHPLQSKGIVLIDEIELHLHPRWQANIISALTATFPNIQFIISTHSPLVINQLKPEQLFVLNDNRIIPGTSIQNTYGMDANSVIAEIMGGSYRPKPVTKAFEQIEQLLDDPKPENLDAAKVLLQELSAKISPNDSELLQLQSLLQLEESEADF